MPLWLAISILIFTAWVVGAAVFWALCAFGGKADDYFRPRHLRLVPPPDPVECVYPTFAGIDPCEECSKAGHCKGREKLWNDEFRPFRNDPD